MIKKLMYFAGFIVMMTNAIITFGDGAWLLGLLDVATAGYFAYEFYTRIK